MSLLDQILQESVWESFYEYKLSLACPKRFTKELRKFTDEKRYIGSYEKICIRKEYPLPVKSVISKLGSDKKRIVYTYPEDEGTLFKLITHLMLRKYDHLFVKGLYSFRPGKTAKDAVRYLFGITDLPKMYAYKADIHDYFNSIPVEEMLDALKKAVDDDPELYEVLSGLLLEPDALYRGRVVTEKKGIMAGTPQSAFYANLFLSEMDRHFSEQGVIYARYSDDIIVFAPTEEEVKAHAEYIRKYLAGHSLSINPSKEEFYAPGSGFNFLGFKCKGDIIDIAPVTLTKLIKKMHRKRDALVRWRKRNDIKPEKAASAFIRVFNRKLLESPRDNELSWSNWFFPVINTTESLHKIDMCAQDCLRYIISGKHTKSRYNVRYEDLKALGYRSLVNAYYDVKVKRSAT
ncbi:MAG: hypothetical protein K6E85_02900 [Lachnospiraceae bacterium]|nr:hypothetical protein [Lachnospiraceae bacterium]